MPAGKNFLADAPSHLPQYNSKREEVVQAMIPTRQSVGQIEHTRTVNPWYHNVKKIVINRHLVRGEQISSNREMILCGKVTNYIFQRTFN